MIGQSLGPYRLVDELGRGGMSTVYLAVRDGVGGLRKVIAVKVLDPRLSDDARMVKLFHTEGRLAARANHHNVVQALDAGRDGGRHYVAMEYVAGKSLNHVISRANRWTRPLAPRVLLGVMAQVLDGMHHLHELRELNGAPMGLVHRDLSPENVVVSFDGAVKVIDLGLASTHTSSKGEVVGKPTYMAPEQARGERVDRRADIFSAAVMCWELASRARMWGDLEPADIVLHLRTRGALPPLHPSVDRGLAAVIDRALHLDRDRRFSTCAEFAGALREAIGPGSTETLPLWMNEAFSAERREVDENVRGALAGTASGPRSVTEAGAPTHTETPRLLPDLGTLQDTIDGLCRLDGVLAAGVFRVDGAPYALAATTDAARTALIGAAAKVGTADDVMRTLAPHPTPRSTSVVVFRDGFLTSRRGPTGAVHVLARSSAVEALIRVGIHAALLKLAELAPSRSTPDSVEPGDAGRVARLTALVAPELGPLGGWMVRRVLTAHGGPSALASAESRSRMARELVGHLRDAVVQKAVLDELSIDSKT